MDKIVNIQNLDPTTLELQTYSTDDQSLISSFDLENSFTSSVDYIEYSVYDINQNLLLYVDNFTNYSILNNNVQLEPEKDLETYGFDEGQYITNYNFFKNILGSNNDNTYYISEISSDRTEIRLDTTLIPNDILINQVNDYKIQLEQSPYYKDFYLNFGNNSLVIANNLLLDNSDPNNPTVLIKLYEPLPTQFDLKSVLWVVETISEPLAYQIDITLIFDNLDENIYLQGPNFNIPIKDRINNSTEFTNFNTLKNTSSTYGTSSLKYQLNSILDEKGFEINIDYTDYSSFVFFSSAQTRLENFYYKMSLIEEYSNLSNQNITGSATSSYYVSSSFDIYQAKINDIISKFDGYEYFLYFESGSKSWPKTNDEIPYINASTGSALVQSWLTTQYVSASNYDENLNPNNLINTIPGYLREDSNNDQYILFVEMIGQHFDSIWVYIKDITNKYNADNRLDHGVSKDLISDVLRDLGVKIYQNNFSIDDLYSSFLGITPGGSLLPPTGSEVINNYVTASFGPYVLPGYVIAGYVNGQPIVVPLADVNASIYKRIYHNVPYLFKKKGTVEGLRALITLYGIPDTILRINEFGGKNKDNVNDWDEWQNQYNYALSSSLSDTYPIIVSGSTYGLGTYGTSSYGSTLNNSGVVIIPWDNLSLVNTVPSSVAFRFKTNGTPTIYPSQSLLYNESSFGDSPFSLVLEYSESVYGSYSGSGAPTSSTYDWSTLKLVLPNVSASCSVYLPLFNEDWWSVLVTKTDSTHSLYVKNKIYDGEDGNQIGFQASSSVVISNPSWDNIGNTYLGGFRSGVTSSVLLGKTYTPYIGTLQEFRYYSVPLSESIFDDFVMNPYSIEGNSLNGSQSSLNILKFRAPLGSVLDNNISQSSRTSIHPSITKVPSTSSFYGGGNDYVITGSFQFIANTETIFLDQFPAGIRNAINNKIKIAQTIFPSGDTLSPYIRTQQESSVSGSYTKDINLLEVALSPQNEINQDIISQYGFFNLGDYIGDPRQIAQNNDYYPDLNTLRDAYFSKYTSNYNLTDYIRLIKYFDNSLFKMIKDFVPARTSLSSGIVIKQHLLERNRYRVPSASYSEPYYTGSVKSFPFDFQSSQLYRTSGGNAGEFDTVYINELTQSWSESIVTPLGIVNTIHSDKSEFLTGELSGSTIVATTQSLLNNPLTSIDFNNIIPNVNLTSSFFDSIYDPNEILLINNNSFMFDNGGGGGGATASLTKTNFIIPGTAYVVTIQIRVDANNAGSSSRIIINLGGNTYSIPATSVPVFSTFYTFTFPLTSGLTSTDFTITFSTPDEFIAYVNVAPGALSIYSYNSEEDLLNSDYYPLLNNAVIARPSTTYMDVDYSSGQSIPTNQGAIITGSATKAPVQDYNWNVRRSILPRYSGSRLTGARINEYNNGDVSYGKEPVINNYQTYFATFKEIRGAYPELVNKSTLWLNSLVDKDGNQLTVDFDTGSAYYYNLIDNFGKDSVVNLQITTLPSGAGNVNNLDQTTTVYRPALLWPKVILTNESGSTTNTNNGLPSYGISKILISHRTPVSGLTPYPNDVLSASLWTVGAGSRNILTSSIQLGNLYDYISTPNLVFINGQPYQNNTITPSGSEGYGGNPGYDPAIDLILKIGQEIRFFQNENYVYTITNAFLLGSFGSKQLYIVLDRQIPASDISAIPSAGFLIREYQTDPSKLVINAPKLVGNAPGYMTPQYMSPDLIANLDKTVETLKETGVL